jgi:hypothetical protein
MELKLSRTYIHKEKAKFNRDIIHYEETSDSFQKQCDRWNFDKAEMKLRKQKLKDKLNDT